MAEQRGYFGTSEWALGGCTTLYQLPEEGKKVLSPLNDFYLCVLFLSLRPLGFDGSRKGVWPLGLLYKSISFIRPWLGGRGSVCVCSGLPLLMVCIIFGLRLSSRLNANTAVKWIICSSSESISEQQLLLPRHQALLYLSFNGAWHYHECYPVRLLCIDRTCRLSARQCPRSVITRGSISV